MSRARLSPMARIPLPHGEGLEVMKAFSLAPTLAAGAQAYDSAVWGRF